MLSSLNASLSLVGPFLHWRFQPSIFTILGHLAMLPAADSGTKEKQGGSQREVPPSMKFSAILFFGQPIFIA